jgi:hypothetical protein
MVVAVDGNHASSRLYRLSHLRAMLITLTGMGVCPYRKRIQFVLLRFVQPDLLRVVVRHAASRWCGWGFMVDELAAVFSTQPFWPQHSQSYNIIHFKYK